jgi:hypothetical protein
VSGAEVSRGRWFDMALLFALKLALGAWILRRGFTHVSDDDYARTVIAEQLAHAPRLDPSGTSWLPLPFWIEGAAMMIAGRSLGVARAVAVVLGAASVCAPYAAMRGGAVPRAAAVVAAVVAMALPWNAWLGVATVPEAWAGALVAAAAVGAAVPSMRLVAAAGLFAASLSRYEAWPACAVLAVLCAVSAGTPPRPPSTPPRPPSQARGEAGEGNVRRRSIARDVACAVVAAIGPIAWMVHNAIAHGSAVHFLARVSAFRHAIGAADAPLRDKLLDYPLALWQGTPEVVALGLAGAVGLVASAAMRARWGWAAATAVAIVAFLVWGDVHDGAPTHHAGRALVAVWWILVGMGIDALAALAAVVASAGPRVASGPSPGRWRAGLVGTSAIVGIAWCASLVPRWDDAPGRSDYDRRDAQIDRGLDMRARGVVHASIVPCSFEHFALLAAWGAPERADIAPRTGEPPTSACPRVVER